MHDSRRQDLNEDRFREDRLGIAEIFIAGGKPGNSSTKNK
jgi:hypothetical protein